MTKEQWETAEQNLQSSYRIVKLQADGYTLSLQTQRYKMQLCIAVYVDGKIQGKWLTEDCEIRRKFFQKHKHSILTRNGNGKPFGRRYFPTAFTTPILPTGVLSVL